MFKSKFSYISPITPDANIEINRSLICFIYFISLDFLDIFTVTLTFEGWFKKTQNSSEMFGPYLILNFKKSALKIRSKT